MTRIYFVRHAEAEGNLYRIAHGHYNSIITPRGYRQIAALRRRFADVPVDAVYASDLWRTCTTARAVYEPKGLPLHAERAFREVGIGVWEGKTWQELDEQDPQQMYCFNHDVERWQVPGCETAREALARFLPELRRVAERHAGGTVVIFSHGMILRLVLGTLQGLTLEEMNDSAHSDNTAVSLAEYENGAFRVVYRDDNSHLLAEPGLSTLGRQTWWKSKTAVEQGLRYVPMTAEDRRALECGGAEVPPSGAVAVRLGEETVGGLRWEADGTVDWYYLLPAWRGRGYGVPPLGQAVQSVRAAGGNALRLRCGDETLRGFFAHVGFVPAEGDEMVHYIGYEERAEI